MFKIFLSLILKYRIYSKCWNIKQIYFGKQNLIILNPIMELGDV